VAAWHDALNAGDLARLLALCRDDVELGGPRGTERGVEALRAWVGRSGIRLRPVQVVEVPGAVVVEQDAEWPTDPRTHRLASTFEVRDGLVARVVRYADLAAARAAVGLSPADADAS
jgi:ketosteroid isomerase-like protein